MVSVKFVTPIAAPVYSDESIYYTATRELQEAIREVRQKKIEEDRKKVDAAGKLSEKNMLPVAKAISVLVGFDADAPISITTALQICNEGIPEPKPEPEPKMWVPDLAAGIAEHTRKLRESERMEAIETARLVELARLKARDEYEAGKRAAPSASKTNPAPSEPLQGAAPTEPYLPKWATAQEAGEWLEFKTGQRWPLVRLVEHMVCMAAWLDCPGNAPAEMVDAIFQGRREGFMAPVVFAGDIERLGADREGATLSMTRRPDGVLVQITPPAFITTDSLRFERGSIQETAELIGTLSPPAVPLVPAPASEPLQDAGQPDAQDTASANTEAVSAPAVKASTAGAGVVRHSTKTRANPLAAVFARAKKEATDATCPHSVWAALVALPASANPPPELGEYRKNDHRIKATGARTGWLTKDAFLDRWRRGNV